MTMKNSSLLKKYSLSINFILGALLVLAFAPVSYWPLGIIIPGLLAYLWQNNPPISAKKSLARGFAFGAGFFGFGVSWIYISIATYGNTNIIVACLVTVLFIAILALFPALQAYSYQRLFKNYPLLNALLIFPSTWVISELVRGSLFTGFPWLYIGYTQTFTPLAGLAKLFGVYGVSWLCVFLGAAIFVLLNTRKLSLCILLVLSMIFAVGISWGLKYHRFTQPVGAPLRVLLVQGNISQPEKWDPRNVNKIINTYMELTAHQFDTPLIIWPENAITNFPQKVAPMLTQLNQTTSQLNSAIVFGIPLINPVDGAVYNGALALGNAQGMYLKRHLVPFGEYVPLAKMFGSVFQILNIPMSYFSKGPDEQYPFIIHGLAVTMFICYESAYPLEVRSYFNNAAYLITLTDDSWFGHSFAASQQEEIEAMRAIETERPILRATNDGITSIIDSNGVIIAKAPSYIATSLKGSIQPVSGLTPWLGMGLWVFLFLLLISILIPLLYVYRKK